MSATAAVHEAAASTMLNLYDAGLSLGVLTDLAVPTATGGAAGPAPAQAPAPEDDPLPGLPAGACGGAVAPEDLKPAKVYPPIASVENDGLTKQAMVSFVSAAVDQHGLVGHNIDGYNELAESGINRIMTLLFDVDRMLRNERTQTEADRSRKTYQVRIQFHDVKVGRPICTTYLTGQFMDLYPGRARLTGIPYSGPVTLGATATVKAHYEDGHVEEKTAEIPPFQVGTFPVMVGSTRCHTSYCTREGLKEMGEDPTDQGGYFIAKRGEYVVDLLENICYNSVHIHKRMKPNEHVRAEFLSQPGGAFENSSQIRIRLMTNGQITIEINSTKFEKVRLPFFLIFRLFGMTSDRDVAEAIVFDVADGGPITARMLDILEHAFQHSDATFAFAVGELNRELLVQQTAERVAKYLTNPGTYATNENAIQYLNEDLLGSPTKPGGLDKVLLPHMGQTAESRIRKLRFIGLLIHKAFLVHFGILPPTDRDSYRNKRVHGSGVSLAKAFKTQVNNSVVIPIYRAFRRELKNNPWESITDKSLIDTFRNSLATSDLNRAMEQAITAGNKTIVVRRRAATNRVSSQALERKNGLNTFSALRTVVTQNAGNASKATERADMMRRVHPTYTGFICVAQSADTGENVGMRKQLAITAGVCTAGEALPLKLSLRDDPAVVRLDAVTSVEMHRRALARVFVNGEWIGCCTSAHELVARYRALRREGRVVDPYTTIYWDPVTDEVAFWLDVGRLRRPLLIVDSNLAEYKAARRAGRAATFVQNIRFTPEHARAIVEGRLTLSDLVREGVAEYVTPEEQENCLVAESIDVLRECRHDVTRQFSHCDVEQAIFGLAAHKPPFGNHTQPARVTYETNQSRQTGGWYVLNFPYRTDKNRFFQFYNEIPLVRTLADKWVPANGTNTTIAYASYGGDNQEDSAIVNQASADRGLFAGAFFRYELAELEKGEVFCNPDALTTKNLKPNASYEKLVDGFIRVGSTVRYGDALIGRVAKLSRGRAEEPGAQNYQFTDRSVIYRLREPAVVEAVLHPRGANDELFGLVKLRYERPLRTGDKMCLTPDHEVLTDAGWRPVAEVATTDRVLALPDTSGLFSFCRPTGVHRYDVDETLYHVLGAGVDQLVTAEHRLPVRAHYGLSIDFQPAYTKPQVIAISPGCFGSNGPPHFDEIGEVVESWKKAMFEGLTALDGGEARRVWDTAGPLIADQCRAAFTERPGDALYWMLAVRVATYTHRLAVPWLEALAALAGNRIRVEPHLGPWVTVKAVLLTPETAISVTETPYKGPVHCLTVPGGVFCVRRKTDGGHAVSWTGNSSRSGNKSIVALMLQQSDMPFTESGLTPDMIVNTHSFPSRMTIGQLIETSLSKVCARRGVIADGTAFLPVDHDEIAAEMHRMGFRYNGRERMYNGMTGEYFDAAIFIGPTAEQRLQKFVLDDEQSVAGSGPTDATTGQPLGGKTVQGGLRLGEMERWGMQAHGSMLNLYEKSHKDSDSRLMYVCRNCGSLAVYNEYQNVYQCRGCGEMADISTVDSTKSAILLHEELAAANVNMRLGLRPREFEERALRPEAEAEAEAETKAEPEPEAEAE